VIVLPMRTSEINRLSTDTSPTLVPLAETMMSPGSRLAWRLNYSANETERRLRYAKSDGVMAFTCRMLSYGRLMFA
jgi:hypothetical protein